MRSRGVVLTVMCVGYFLVLLDVTIVNLALPSIDTGLGAGVSGLQWVVDGYAVALAALLLAAGTTGDLLGHRRTVLAGLVVFGVASLGCAAAPTTGVLVAARVVQGVGAALLLPGTLAIISRAFPGREQARAIGAWAAVGSIALPAGPLLGGLLVELFGWRAVFAVNLPVVVVSFAVAARVVREDRAPSDRRLDVPGLVLGALTLGSTTLAVIDLGHDGWSWTAGVALVVAVLTACGFVAAELRASDPMLPLGLFRRPAFTTANAVAGTMNLGTLGTLFVMTSYLQVVQGRSALATGLALFPLFAPLPVLAPLTGRVTSRTGPRRPMAVGLVTSAVGMLLLLRTGTDTSYAVLLPALLLWGIGLGVLTPAVVAAAVASVEPTRAGLATGLNNTARQAGGALGIAAYGAVAGPAQHAASYVGGLHLLAVATAAFYAVSAAATGLFVQSP
jgi:DHA2 family methylenomycin A resistance protein-like MFS transporter